MLTLIKAAYFWIIFILITVFSASAVHVTHWLSLLGLISDDGQICHRFATFWAKGIIGLMPGWKIDIRGNANIPQRGTSFVIVSNHESVADIWVMYYIGTQFKWLSKIENFRITLIGSAMKAAGYVAVDRGDRDSHHKAMDKSAEWLRRNVPMVFFPEGTRSHQPGTIGAFKVGAFKLAKEQQKPVLPVIISGAGNLIRKGSGIPGTTQIKVKILPVVTCGVDESIDSFTQRVRDMIVEERQMMDQGLMNAAADKKATLSTVGQTAPESGH